VFSKLNPLLAVAGALLFAASGAVGNWAKVFLGPNYFNFIQMLPYVVTLIAVAGVIGRARFPKATGVPYRRE
jgi:simple sugar transport system permease protein